MKPPRAACHAFLVLRQSFAPKYRFVSRSAAAKRRRVWQNNRLKQKDGRALISCDILSFAREYLTALHDENRYELSGERLYLFCERLGRFAQI